MIYRKNLFIYSPFLSILSLFLCDTLRPLRSNFLCPLFIRSSNTPPNTAQAVLDARALFPDASLADLYDPDTMPPELARAHQRLDRLVEKAYGRSFESDAERVAFLFERYQALTADLFTDAEPKKRRQKKEN